MVTDLSMRNGGGLELCERIVANRPDVPVPVITAFGSLDTAIAAIRAGAYEIEGHCDERGTEGYNLALGDAGRHPSRTSSSRWASREIEWPPSAMERSGPSAGNRRRRAGRRTAGPTSGSSPKVNPARIDRPLILSAGVDSFGGARSAIAPFFDASPNLARDRAPYPLLLRTPVPAPRQRRERGARIRGGTDRQLLPHSWTGLAGLGLPCAASRRESGGRFHGGSIARVRLATFVLLEHGHRRWIHGRSPRGYPDEATEEGINAFIWGQTFTTGAMLNAAAAGASVYVVLYWLLERYRTHGLSRLYRSMKRHQRRVAPQRKLGEAG